MGIILPVGMFGALVVGSGALGCAGAFKGRIPFSKTRTISGVPARVIGVVCLVLCAALCVGTVTLLAGGFRE